MKRVYEFPWPDLRKVHILHCWMDKRSAPSSCLILFFLTMALLSSMTTYAQERVVTGKVTSAADEQLIPGVNVIVKGTTVGTATDKNGEYTLTLPENSNASFVSNTEVEGDGVEVIQEDDHTWRLKRLKIEIDGWHALPL